MKIKLILVLLSIGYVSSLVALSEIDELGAEVATSIKNGQQVSEAKLKYFGSICPKQFMKNLYESLGFTAESISTETVKMLIESIEEDLSRTAIEKFHVAIEHLTQAEKVRIIPLVYNYLIGS